MEDVKNELKYSSENILRLISGAIVGEDVEILLETLPNSKNSQEVSKLADLLLNLCWEKLNIGYWKNVDISWRYLFSFASIYKALSSAENETNIKEALLICDKGLLMGAPIENNILARLASNLHRKLVPCMEPSFSQAEILLEKENFTVSINNEKAVPEENDLSLMKFMTDYYGSEKPVLITGAMAHWPAMDKWNLTYLRKVAGFRTVPVEVGSKYTDDNWSQKLITINEFIDEYIEKDRIGPVGYLAQHQLFDQIQELRDDICIPEYCLAGSAESEVDINSWFGPASTVSPMHYDPRGNLFTQIFGTKYVRVYSPALSPWLYPHEDRMLKNTSQVDVENPDYAKFPMFKEADYFECFVKPGQMLFIPKKWWHFIRSLSNSFSVSYWFGEATEVEKI